MSNIDLIIEERSRNIGHFIVGRLLPFAKKRMVGPFIFIDHIGPSMITSGRYLDVDQHPHIGLSTLTYLFEGEIMHRDSLGNEQRITPGDVNWMSAGRGVVHTERTPQDLRNGKEYQNHGFQIWVALPRELEEMEPEFHHISKSSLPQWEEGNLHYTLIAGDGYGQRSPVPVHSALFMIKIETAKPAELNTQTHLQGEIGFCVVRGAIHTPQARIDQGKMLVSMIKNDCQIRLEENTTLLLFGGQPFREPRHIFWNFVSSDTARIEKACRLWEQRKFPPVQGDHSYVPLPSSFPSSYK